MPLPKNPLQAGKLLALVESALVARGLKLDAAEDAATVGDQLDQLLTNARAEGAESAAAGFTAQATELVALQATHADTAAQLAAAQADAAAKAEALAAAESAAAQAAADLAALRASSIGKLAENAPKAPPHESVEDFHEQLLSTNLSPAERIERSLRIKGV